MAAYKGSIEVISGITQKNNGTFMLMDSKYVQYDDTGKSVKARLDELLDVAGTDENVKTTPATTGVIYLSGKDATAENIGPEYVTSTLYYDVSTETLHVKNITASVEGTTDAANRLATARNISLAGDVTGTTTFDGSQNVTITAVLANTGVTAGNYGQAAMTTLGSGGTFSVPYLTINSKGQITTAMSNTITLPQSVSPDDIGEITNEQIDEIMGSLI